MRNKISLIAAIVFMAAAGQSFAQSTNSRIVNTITTSKRDKSFATGRDYWFAPAQNYLDEPGKYIRIYITSPNNTTAYVQTEGVTTAIVVPSYGVGTFDLPLTNEMKSSGVIENKAIHVYDQTDDIEVYFVSHNPYSSDGTNCIPTIGWGTDYVVASYASLYDGSNSSSYDFPSEFTIAADQDNTTVEITPSCDLRLTDVYPGNDTTVAFLAGQKFEVTLNRGQSVQYQAVLAKARDIYDVTGTVIHSNVNIGVIGASMCTNIPQDFPYCNYVTGMLPPIRAWGEYYYAVNNAQPLGVSGHDFSTYLMISSIPNQVINRRDNISGVHTEAVLSQAYDHYYVEEESSNEFSSNAPFLLVQYINSSSYPDGVVGNGNPGEVVIPPVENYGTNVLFVVPASNDNIAPYDNYANVIVNVNDESNATFDGHNVRLYTKQPVDGIHDIFVIPNISSGAHVVRSDSGAGVYLYGYGANGSYLWGSSSNATTFNSPDIIPPSVLFSGDCFAENIHITDSGYLKGDSGAMQSGLNEIRVDSDINMEYIPDPYPFWLDGAQLDTTGVGMYVIDDTKPATLVLDVFDAAGNETIIRSAYTPQILNINPTLQNFGTSTAGSPAVVRYDSIINVGKVPFTLSQLSLKYGNQGFEIDSADTRDPIPSGGTRLIKISFYFVQLTLAVDSFIIGDQCTSQTTALVGSGSSPDFFVQDAVWQNAPLVPPSGSGWTERAAVIHNLSKSAIIHIRSAGWNDNVHFQLVPGQTFPVAVPPLDTASVYYYFEPTNTDFDTSQASWTASEVMNSNGSLVIRYDKLIGNAVTPSLTFTGDTTINLYCLDTSVHSVAVSFLLSNTGVQSSSVKKVVVSDTKDFTNLTGWDQHKIEWNPATQSMNIPAGAVDTIKTTVPVNPTANSSFTTRIAAIGASGDTIGALTTSVNVNYNAASISTTNIPFGPVAYQSAKVPGVFIIWNTGSSDLAIDTITFREGGEYNSSFSFATNPPLPDILPAGQTMTVNAEFDPSISSDPTQNSELEILSDACNVMPVNLDASLVVSSVAKTIAPQSLATVVVLDNDRGIRVTIPSDWTLPSRFDIYNILGDRVFASSLDATTLLDLGALPSGAYFYRIQNGETSQTGKILLEE